MIYFEQYSALSNMFKLGKNTQTPDKKTAILFYPFDSMFDSEEDKYASNLFQTDKSIQENNHFVYPVFVPDAKKQYDKVILMLHGLNERTWDKYLPWADYLCRMLNRPVILFPLAFHVNRSPQIWSNPREMMRIVELRRYKNGEDCWSSFANAALSERITEKPLRFYRSGRQSYSDISAVFEKLKNGGHPLFKENCTIAIFAYSIGAFLSQILLMSNPKNLFTGTKLFMFCGGSIFNSMYGCSKSIMDKNAYKKMMDYYSNDFEQKNSQHYPIDIALDAFISMISADRNYEKRTRSFENLSADIAGIALEKDIVIPYKGINEALGSNLAKNIVRLMDFPFEYSHEIPFPINAKTDKQEVNNAFETVFGTAAGFFS
jgi:hypothetical protein